jgi:hypothetical protein
VHVRFSCLVDSDPTFAREALRWHRSLVELAQVPNDDIIVHHTPTASAEALAAFAAAGIRTAIVEPVSSVRPHLYKVAQLGSAFLREADLAVLCDCDTVFVSDPRPYLVAGRAAAAVVDRPFPPVEVWDELLALAGLSRQRPDTQVGAGPEPTLHENRNGGLYVLPGSLLPALDPCWRKWAAWLGTQPKAVGKYVYFTDQMAFALACLDLRIDPLLLDKRFNFPTHFDLSRTTDCAPVMLHYHKNVDEAGNLTHVGAPTVDAAIDHVNRSLARPAISRKRRKLLLHVGLPKTGTSALQKWCHANTAQLREQGIVYPEPSGDTAMPKHQFMVSDLMKNEFQATRKALGEGSDELLVLTSEGLTNHLYDFRPAALKTFRELLAPYETTVFMVIREKEKWVRSYYKQCAINPEIRQYSYATDKSLEEFAGLQRVQRLLNNEALAEDCRAAFGAGHVEVVKYEEDWKGAFLRNIGFAGDAPDFPDVNTSVPDWILDFVVRVNGMGLGGDARAAWLGAVHKYAGTGHVGLENYAMAAESRKLWSLLDPESIADVLPDDARWEEFPAFVQALSGREQRPRP